MLSRRALIVAVTIAIGAVAARAQGSSRVTLDDFMDVSQRLLPGSALDREIAQLFLTAINADAATAVTLEYVVQSNGNPTPEQATLRATIVEWWRTGVYEINGEPRLAARSRAVWSEYRTPQPSQMAQNH